MSVEKGGAEMGETCSYITYEQYRALGGSADTSAFPRLVRLARKKLDYWTQNRIVETDEDIQLCMALLIDAMDKADRGQKDIASYSNDGVSVTYAAAQTDEQRMASVYDRIVEILPAELVNLGVGP